MQMHVHPLIDLSRPAFSLSPSWYERTNCASCRDLLPMQKYSSTLAYPSCQCLHTVVGMRVVNRRKLLWPSDSAPIQNCQLRTWYLNIWHFRSPREIGFVFLDQNCCATSAAGACRKGSPIWKAPCWEVEVKGKRDRLPYPKFDLDG